MIFFPTVKTLPSEVTTTKINHVNNNRDGTDDFTDGNNNDSK